MNQKKYSGKLTYELTGKLAGPAFLPNKMRLPGGWAYGVQSGRLLGQGDQDLKSSRQRLLI
jgi:hypothetical protein